MGATTCETSVKNGIYKSLLTSMWGGTTLVSLRILLTLWDTPVLQILVHHFPSSAMGRWEVG